MSKKITPRQRWILWSLLLCLTLTAAAWLEDEPGADEGAPRKRQAQRLLADPKNATKLAEAPANEWVTRLELPPGPPEKSDTEEPKPVTEQATQPNLFAARSWYVPPPPPPPEKPKAPPLPFKIIGRVIDPQDPVVFVSHQNRHLVLRAGDQIDSQYQVESIDRTRIVFLYLPLKEQQVLSLGAAN